MARKFVSMTIFFSFLVLFLSSFILYVIPGGGVGAAAWAFLSLNRMQWVDLHITSGLLFLLFGLWHTALNWKPIASGFRKVATSGLKSAWPVLAALALNLFILAGTLGHFQPVESALAYYKQAKQEFRHGSSR